MTITIINNSQLNFKKIIINDQQTLRIKKGKFPIIKT
jgi:hypothetical protein